MWLKKEDKEWIGESDLNMKGHKILICNTEDKKRRRDGSGIHKASGSKACES